MRKTITGVVLGGFLAVGAGAAPASAAGDTTAPTLNLPSSAAFVSGTAIGDSTAPGSDYDYWTFAIPMQVSWTATDSSGVCGYDIGVIDAAGQRHTMVRNTKATSYRADTDDYNGDQGGGSMEIYSWTVTARDCAGNTTTKVVKARPTVHQEDGLAYEGQSLALTYSGAWTRSTCACWSGDADRNSRTGGGKATISRTWTSGQSVALIMERAANRGAARVLVDGVQKATVDTYSASPVHRSVVWTYRMPAGKHTVQIVNAGTANRSRIDLDAVLVG